MKLYFAKKPLYLLVFGATQNNRLEMEREGDRVRTSYHDSGDEIDGESSEPTQLIIKEKPMVSLVKDQG